VFRFSLQTRRQREWRDPDSNRGHQDFQSENPCPDVSYPILVCGLGKTKIRLSRNCVSERVRVRPGVYCYRIAATFGRPEVENRTE